MKTEIGRKRLTSEHIAGRVVWVKALLSGTYRQGNGGLRIYDAAPLGAINPKLSEDVAYSSWCCLGVAGHTLGLGADSLEDMFLPRKWAEDHLGLTRSENATSMRNDQSEAAHWNDQRNLNFKEIADRIALATDMKQRFSNIPSHPIEFSGKEPGTYATEWLERMNEDL